MLEGDIGLEGLSPKEDPAAREYPGAAQGGEGPPIPAPAASGTPGDGGFSGTEGHTGAGDRDPCLGVGGPPPRCSLVRRDTLSAAGHWGHPRRDRQQTDRGLGWGQDGAGLGLGVAAPPCGHCQGSQLFPSPGRASPNLAPSTARRMEGFRMFLQALLIHIIFPCYSGDLFAI